MSGFSPKYGPKISYGNKKKDKNLVESTIKFKMNKKSGN